MASLKDYATGTVSVAPSPATSGTTMTLQTSPDEGARMPGVPYYATAHPDNQLPTLDNAEKILVTGYNAGTKVLTFTRAQGSTTAKSIAVGWRISNAVFKDDLFNSSIVNNEVPSGTVNGSNTAFTLASAPATGAVLVYLNGVRQKITDDYTISGTTITFVDAPLTGDKILVDYIIGNSVNSVGTNSYIAKEAVTGSVNGSNTTFTTARAYIAGSLEVYINGLKQGTAHVTETTPASGVFTVDTAPATGDVIEVAYQFNLNPSGNSDTVDGYHGDDLSPIGSMIAYAGTTTPSGNWLFCYGQAISRTTYATLFSRLSTTYGVGDGSTTFNIPDLRGRTIAGQDDMGGSSANRLTGASGSVDGDVLGGTGGAETHTLTTAQLASHSHDMGNGVNQWVSGGSPGSDIAANIQQTGASFRVRLTGTDAAGGGTAHNNVQPTIILNYIIKAL